MYIYIYMLYGIQDPGPWIHVTVHTDPCPVPHETTNTVYHYTAHIRKMSKKTKSEKRRETVTFPSLFGRHFSYMCDVSSHHCNLVCQLLTVTNQNYTRYSSF